MKVRPSFKRSVTVAVVILLISGTFFSLAGCLPTAQRPKPAREDLILATTTSTQDSGLLDLLLPKFEKQYGYKVKVVAVGSGEVIEMGKGGNCDVLLVHSPADEESFMSEGFGGKRMAVMHNDYVLLGTPTDPAAVKGMKVADAFRAVFEKKAAFVSRADNSGTHKKELKIWAAAGLTPTGESYIESGQGMGESLTLASEKEAYILTDRGTYLSMGGSLNLVILIEGEEIMFNPYHVMTLNRGKFASANHRGAIDFTNFMTSKATQKMIAEFGKDKFGQPLFYLDAS